MAYGGFPTTANGPTVRSWDGVSHCRTPRTRGSVEILTAWARTGLSSRCPGPTLSTLCNVGLAGSIAESYRAPYGPCFEAHRKSYSLEGERRPIQPGRSHTRDRGDHGKYQPSGGASVNQQTVEAERTPEPEVTGGNFRSRARVVYCVPVDNDQFAVGLQLFAAAGSWRSPN